MIKYTLITLAFSFLFLGCSAKEFNAGADSITSDITGAFEDSKDTSSK